MSDVVCRLRRGAQVSMSDLTRFRDHCHRMAGKSATPPREATLWLLLADEIDAHLAAPEIVTVPLWGEA